MADLKINKKENLVKTIEINDKGDIIEIDLGDNDFMKKLFDIRTSGMSLKDAESDSFDFDNSMKEFYISIKKLLGEDIFIKTFDNENPSFLLVYDLLEQITEFINNQLNTHFGRNLNRAQRRASTRG